MKIKFIKTVVPKIVAYTTSLKSDEVLYDYRCPECGLGIADDYMYCPYCGNELDWDKIEKPKSEEYKKLFASL